MSANISRNSEGKDEMAFFGQKPWHGLGTEVSGLMTAAEALTAASLDWTVTKQPIYTKVDNAFIPMEGQFATVRGDNNVPLGVVGSRYMPLQNKDALSLLDAIVQDGKAKYETIGALGKGEQVWLLARVPESISVAGEEHLPYIMLSNSHDGKTPVIVQFCSVRVVCANTLAAALSEGRKQFRSRHTPDLTNKVEEAREILGMAHQYFDAYVQEAEKLIKYKPSKDQIMDYFGKLYKVDSETVKELLANGKVAKGDLERHVVYSYNLFREGAGNDVAPVAGSAYALLQGVSDYLDHQVTLRKGNTQEQRFEKAFFGLNANIKQNALDYAVAMAN